MAEAFVVGRMSMTAAPFNREEMQIYANYESLKMSLLSQANMTMSVVVFASPLFMPNHHSISVAAAITGFVIAGIMGLLWL